MHESIVIVIAIIHRGIIIIMYFDCLFAFFGFRLCSGAGSQFIVSVESQKGQCILFQLPSGMSNVSVHALHLNFMV